MTQKKKLSQKLSQAQQAQKHKQQKRRKKEQKQLAQRLKKQKQQQAIADQKVKLIYESGLTDAYKYFLSQAYKEDVKFNIFEYAAQKILKFEKLRREKNKKISQLEKGLGKVEQINVEIEQKSKEKLKQQKSQKKLLKDQVSKEKKNKQRQPLRKS